MEAPNTYFSPYQFVGKLLPKQRISDRRFQFTYQKERREADASIIQFSGTDINFMLKQINKKEYSQFTITFNNLEAALESHKGTENTHYENI